MNFDESLAYLLALGNEVTAMKLGLENIGKLLAALGNPQKKYLKVQIAGTNGKGSTCAFLEAICVRANIKVGLTTSPHLSSITERVKIDGEEIGEDDFARQATLVKEISERLVQKGELETVPTFFEQITAIALNYFAERKIELALLETGLGGRFDATTAAEAEIAAITPVDFDHQQILGDTLAEIAAEKAAIIGEYTKAVVSSPQSAKAKKAILERSAKFGLTPEFADFKGEIVASENGILTVDFQTEKAEYADVKLNIPGRHQIENAKTAILSAEKLQEYFNITKENISEGLRSATHKGRLEFLENILFDGAHNVAGAKALAAYFDEFIDQPITLLFGAMRDKDLREIAEILFPKATVLIFTGADNPRSAETSELIKFVPDKFDEKNVFQTENVAEALKVAADISPEDFLICVTGSLYLVGEARKQLEEICGRRAVT